MRFCPIRWLMRKIDRSPKARSITLPAPVGGLNTRDALAAMDPIYCSSLVNWFPTASNLEMRKGVSVQTTQTGLNSSSAAAGFVKYGETSLWVAVYKQSTSELILKDIVAGTTQTISGHAVVYAPSYTQFTNSAGVFVAAVFRNNDATNNYYTYDGTTWTARTAATTNSQAFSFVASFRNRLWFLSDTAGKRLSAYYLPTSAITGTTVEFPLGGFASKGGNLYAIGTWTRDGGEGGSDDLIVFTTTAGQVIVYQGTDPASPSTFALVGVFDVSRPIGKPIKFGSDLLLPSEDGLYSMNAILGGSAGPEFAISDIIRPTWQEFAATAISVASANTITERVSITYSPKLKHLMVFMRNFGTAGHVSCVTFAMNVITKAWTRYAEGAGNEFRGYNVDTLLGDIYFSNLNPAETAATIYKFGTATIDGTASAISGTAIQAYNILNMPGITKYVTAVRPYYVVGGQAAQTMQIFAQTNFNPNVQIFSDHGPVATGTYAPILSIAANGVAIAAAMSATLATTEASNTLAWNATDVLFIPGGFV